MSASIIQGKLQLACYDVRPGVLIPLDDDTRHVKMLTPGSLFPVRLAGFCCFQEHPKLLSTAMSGKASFFIAIGCRLGRR